MKIVDGDSHFIEPLDLFPRYIEPAYRERAMRMVDDPVTGKQRLVVDGKPMHLGSDTEEMLSIIVGHGQKEEGHALNEFDRSLITGGDWQNMNKRVQFLDAEGIDCQVLFPTLGLLWEGEINDPLLADALCRAYNTWAFEICTGHLNRLFPAAHISLRDPALAVREMHRVAKLGGRSVMVGSAPVPGKSFGHSDYDPVWAAAMGPQAVAEAGANGYHLAAAPPAPLQKIYDDALRQAGHDPTKFQRAGLHVSHVAEAHDKAWDECEAHVHWHMQVHYSRIMAAPENKGLVQAIAPNRALTVPPVGELRKQGRGPYGPAYVGAPDEVIKMLEEELKVCPMTQMIFIIDHPGMAPRHIRTSLELLAKEVIPHFRNK